MTLCHHLDNNLALTSMSQRTPNFPALSLATGVFRRSPPKTNGNAMLQFNTFNWASIVAMWACATPRTVIPTHETPATMTSIARTSSPCISVVCTPPGVSFDNPIPRKKKLSSRVWRECGNDVGGLNDSHLSGLCVVSVADCLRTRYRVWRTRYPVKKCRLP